MLTQLKQEIVAVGSYLFERRLSHGSSGNISLRNHDSGYICTPTNARLGFLETDDLSVLDTSWKLISGKAPTKEVPLHRLIYDLNPEAGAVVHLHSPAMTALSCIDRSDDELLRPLTPYLAMRTQRKISVMPYFKPGASDIGHLFPTAPTRLIIMRNHGFCAIGENLEEALIIAEEAEAAADVQIRLHSVATREITPEQIRLL